MKYQTGYSHLEDYNDPGKEVTHLNIARSVIKDPIIENKKQEINKSEKDSYYIKNSIFSNEWKEIKRIKQKV